MNASELYRTGRLAEAIDAQLLEVKAQPGDQAKRVFLYELLVFAGELDRAERQIQALKFDDTDLDLAALSYRKLLDSERARRRFFAEGVPPEFLGEPPEHVRLRVAAVLQLHADEPSRAAELLDQAEEARPKLTGQLNGREFSELRDADDLFAGILEVMANGRYHWIGLEQVSLLAANPPKYPRDLIYLPANLEAGDRSVAVFLPTLYPGSFEHADDQVRLGRMTDWTTLDGGPTLGVGLHQFLCDDDEISLLEWREFRPDAE